MPPEARAGVQRSGNDVRTTTIRPRRLALLLSALPTLFLLTPIATHAGELDLATGFEDSRPNIGNTYTWAIEYRQPFSEHLAASFTWLNEGHLVNHHRDGQAAQLWWSSHQNSTGFVFEAGLGPYHYYDTTGAEAINTPQGQEIAFENAHGWGVLASASLDWYFKHGWFTFLRLNDIEAAGEVRSTAILLGVGYRFGERYATRFNQSDAWFAVDPPRSEMDVMAGRAVLNSFRSEASSAQALSLRTKITPHFAASLTYTEAQDIPLDWHSGAAVQLWAETSLTSAFSVGAGVGVFITADRSNTAAASSATDAAGILGITMAYTISSRWVARAIWNRVTTRDDDDSDIVLVGLGYRF
jgi:hypothetical protein